MLWFGVLRELVVHCYASWCKVPQRTPHKLLKSKEILVTVLSENPRVGAERGPVRFRPRGPLIRLISNIYG